MRGCLVDEGLEVGPLKPAQGEWKSQEFESELGDVSMEVR
jgi:hypothetical protein